jgi:voltage-gated potassium channel
MAEVDRSQQMPEPHPPSQMERWIDRRFSGRALRPRYAARVIAIVWLVVVVVFGVIERIVEPDTFGSVWLAFWWALQTITTVGYGDVVPQDTAGKAIGAILMLGGLSLLSVITATITSAFVTRRQAELQASGNDPAMRQLRQIESRLDGIDAELRRIGGDGSPPGPTS